MTEMCLGVSNDTKIGKFDICIHTDGQYIVRFSGHQYDLADNLFGLGIAGQLVQDGEETFLIINEADMDILKAK